MTLPTLSYALTVFIAQTAFAAALIYVLQPKYDRRWLLALLALLNNLPLLPGLAYLRGASLLAQDVLLLFTLVGHTLTLVALGLCFRDRLWCKLAAYVGLSAAATLGGELKTLVFRDLFSREDLLAAAYNGRELAVSVPLELLGLGLLLLAAWLLKKLLNSLHPGRKFVLAVSLILGLLLLADYAALFFLTTTEIVSMVAATTWTRTALLALGLALLSLLLYLGVARYDKRQLQRQVAELEQDMRQQYELFLSQLAQNEEMYKLRHDLENHLVTIRSLLGRDQQEQAEQYFDQLLEQYGNHSQSEYCRHAVANIVLQNKAAQCRSQDISFTAEVNIPAASLICDMDMVCLLTNLLDNAIQAAAASAEKRVELRAAPQAGWLALRLENSCAAGAESKAGQQHTGWGMKIVHGIMRKYDGEMKIETPPGLYRVCIMLPCQ